MIHYSAEMNSAAGHDRASSSALDIELLKEIASRAYELAIKRLAVDPETNVSHLNMCSQLSRHLLALLHAEGIAAQREKHESPDGAWHVLVSHGTEPSASELVTDLCPWQFTPDSEVSGFYHGTRLGLQEALYNNGASAEAVGLVGLTTIIQRPYID